MSPARIPPWARPMLCTLAASAVGAAVWFCGEPELPLPAGWGTAAWLHWWSSIGPLVAVFAVGRVLVVVAAAVLVAAFGFLTVAMSASGGRNAIRKLVSSHRLPGCGPVLRLAIGLTASGAAMAACGTVAEVDAGTASPPPAPSLTNVGPAPAVGAHADQPGPVPAPPPAPPRRDPPAPVAQPGGPVPGGPAPGGPVPGGPVPGGPAPGALRPARPAPTAQSAGPAHTAHTAGPAPTAQSAGPGPSARPSVTSSPAAQPATWRVRPGDSLWSIAEAAVGSSPERVAAYWADLIRINRATLPDPADPSLLFPGDVVIVPPR